ncbi:MAG: metal-sensing transcriptional repressor [Erysipelotrichaceae bacterium]|nr:metal-sensing transcriptional repressor [Erysipelotrichaceae bacterium]
MVADSKNILKLLKTVRGQIDGIIKMVEEDKYCINISHQLLASEALINKINKEVLTAHLKSCVNNADSCEERDEKIDEFVSLLGKVMK